MTIDHSSLPPSPSSSSKLVSLMNFRFLLPLFFVLLCGGIFLLSNSEKLFRPQKKRVVVAVTQIADHPALNIVYNGVKSALKDAGYIDGENLALKHESAHGNLVTANVIAHHFASIKPDCAVAISTSSAQSLARYSFPIVFSSVTDPIGANLVSNLEKPGKNITGVSDYLEAQPQVELILRVLPHLKSLGVLYNPSEINSVKMINSVKAYCKHIDITVFEAIVSSTIDVNAAALSLLGKVDAIFVPTDNTVVSAIATLADIGVKRNLPIFAADVGSVIGGALAGRGYDFYKLGYKAGTYVVEILNGKKAGDLPVAVDHNIVTWINSQSASNMGVKIPQDVIEEAQDMAKKEAEDISGAEEGP